METDPANQLERIVALIGAHPFAFVGAVLAILLILAFRKEGPLPKFLDLLTERSRLEAAKESRRIEMIAMIERRSQAPLPGLEKE